MLVSKLVKREDQVLIHHFLVSGAQDLKISAQVSIHKLRLKTPNLRPNIDNSLSHMIDSLSLIHI